MKERLGDFERDTKCILDSDTFLARSDYKGLTEMYADIHSLLSVLEQTKMLEPYCKANKISVKKARAFLALYQDLASGEPKSVKEHNEHFVSKHLKEERYYLDHMDAPAALPAAERRKIDQLFAGMDYEPDKLTQSAARALSDWAGYTVVATTPAAPDLCIAHFEVVQVGRYSAAVLAVTGAGGVRTRVARVEGGLSRADAVQLAGLLNHHLTFVSPPDLTEALLADLAASLGPRRKELWGVVRAAADLLEEAAKPRVHVEGIAHLLEWPELSGDLARVLELFGNEETGCRLCTSTGQRGDVLLGEDLEDPIPGLSVIRKRYLAGGGLMGGLAIVGPARMPFQKLMPGLDYFALKLGQSMAGNLQEDAT